AAVGPRAPAAVDNELNAQDLGAADQIDGPGVVVVEGPADLAGVVAQVGGLDQVAGGLPALRVVHEVGRRSKIDENVADEVAVAVADVDLNPRRTTAERAGREHVVGVELLDAGEGQALPRAKGDAAVPIVGVAR